jgi:pimeloyl-ACP methyl ester carboxylesterase
MTTLTPTKSRIDVAGLRVTHIAAGEGTPLLMLHGWGANADLMMPLGNRLMPLGYRVYAPDLPGFGGSDLPPAAWSVRDYVNFTLAYMDALSLDRVLYFGHSNGGRIGLVLGAEHSARVSKMVLADSAGVRLPAPVATRARLKAYRAVRQTLSTVGLKATSDRLRNWYNDRYGSTDFKNAGPLRETFIRIVGENLLPVAAQVKVPTLLLWGDGDDDTPLAHGQLLEKTIPDAGLVVLNGAGHYSYIDKAIEATRIVDYFYRH